MKINPLILAVFLVLVRIAPAACSQEVPDNAAATGAADKATKDWRLMLSPLTLHYSYDPEHRYVYMLGLERQYPSGVVAGGAFFSNSFGQPSGYAFGGYRFTHVAGYDPFFVEVTGGLIYGYVAPYNHKIPFDYKGFAPGAVASLGWQLTPTFSTQVNLLGLAAVMFQVSADF
jgi:opacity protein-like surface antigen